MTRILVTGMSGTGKSTLLAELARRGRRTVDTDDVGWKTPDGLWDESRMCGLLKRYDDVFVSGTVENQGRFGATMELDGRRDVAQLADTIETLGHDGEDGG